jgi:asparaginyl-tRNA synthetase
MRIRAALISAAFNFFVRRNFTLINSPIFVQSACEGGSTLFEVGYFGDKVFLSQSAQLYEEAAIESLGKVFVLQPAFRAEKSKTARHLTEFWMIESEQAFAGQEDNMKLQEELVHHILAELDGSMSREFTDLGKKIRVHEPPFTRITYDEARGLITKRGVNFDWGQDLPTEGEMIVSKAFDGPVFITGYPLSARSFYHMTRDDDPRLTLSADLFAPEGYGEIATGGQRIHDYETLRKRIEAQELPAQLFQWYLDLRRFGMPPHSGFGLGVERMLRWICGLKHIRSTALFPRTITRVTP